MQLCRLCCRPVNTRRPPGAEEPDTRRLAQDSTTAGQEEKGRVRMAVKMLGGTRVAGWSFSGTEKKETRADGANGDESLVLRFTQGSNDKRGSSAPRVVRLVNL